MQDPGASLNPRFSAYEIVNEPLEVRRPRSTKSARIDALLERVGIDNPRRRAAEFSGGERARLAIARAIAALPEAGGLLILDESLTSLDPGTQAQIVSLLAQFRESNGLGCVLISHDLDLLAGVVERIVILHEGRVVDQGPVALVMHNPQHEQTVRLLDAMTGRH
jgi:ABC-type glutathione transport system ATPase component